MSTVKRRRPTKAQRLVFGKDCKIDPETGLVIEQGHGAPGHETVSHWEARLKAARLAETVDPAEVKVCEAGLVKARAEAAARILEAEGEEEEDDDEEF